jgi:hypothetical protein
LRSRLKTPAKAAFALYEAILKLYKGSNSPDAFKPTPVLDYSDFDSDTAAMIQDLREGRYHRMGQILKDASDAGVLGVSILSNIGGIVLSIGLAEESEGDLNLAMSAAKLIPWIGKYTARVGRPLVMRFSSKAGHVDEIVIPATASEALIDALGIMGKGDRVASMRALKPLIESGEVSAEWIDLWIRAKWLQGPGDKYLEVLGKGLNERLGRWLRGTARHHELPVGSHQFGAKVINLEKEFLKRGLDPNDGALTGSYVEVRFHNEVLHSNVKGQKVKWGRKIDGTGSVFNGGAWNYQWFKFFDDFPESTADDIMAFREDLVSRTSDLTKRSSDDIDWPYPAPPSP